MTRHRHAQTGLVTPSPLDRWIDATLRVLAMLVLNVASTFQMKQLRPKRDWHTPDDEAALPRMKTDTHKEQHAAQHRSSLNSAHGEQRSSAARPSNHERVLTAPSPSVSLTTSAIHLPLPRRWRQEIGRGIASTAEGGGGGSMRSIETEGASHKRHSIRSSRRKSGPRASRVMCVTGLLRQPWLPACAGTSGFLNPPNKTAAA
jgi:hypothetical protein